MQTIQFSLQGGTAQAITPAFSAENIGLLKKTFAFENVEVYTEEEVEQVGALGHAVLMPWQFEQFSYKETDSTGTRTIGMASLLLPIVMVEISRKKNMEMTDVEGRDGSVKEYGSHGDFVMNVKGIFLGDGAYPKKERDGLAAFEAAKVAVPVANKLLNDLYVFDVVIDDLRWVPLEGVQHAQAFEFTAYSDSPVALKLQGEV